jgi:LPXTG-motif cell wall-anchored protein
MRSFAKFLGALAFGLTAVLFSVAPTSALAEVGSYIPPEISAPPVVPPGGAVTVTGTGFLPNAPVTVSIVIGGVTVVLGTTMSDANGNWSFVFDAPAGGGTYAVTGTDGVNTLTTDITVGGSNVPAHEGLPFTGASSTVTLTQIGAGLVAAGALVALFVRKRRHADEKVKVGS